MQSVLSKPGLSPAVFFLLTVPRWFVCCSFCSFWRLWFHMWHSLFHHLFFISPYSDHSKRLCFVIVEFPGHLHLLLCLFCCFFLLFFFFIIFHKRMCHILSTEYTIQSTLIISNANRPGPSCSKLTTSLVNDSLKFTSSDTQIF